MDRQLLRQKSHQKFSVMKTKKLAIPEKYFVSALFTFCLEDNRNTSVYVFITEIFWLTLDVIIDDPYLTLLMIFFWKCLACKMFCILIKYLSKLANCTVSYKLGIWNWKTWFSVEWLNFDVTRAIFTHVRHVEILILNNLPT